MSHEEPTRETGGAADRGADSEPARDPPEASEPASSYDLELDGPLSQFLAEAGARGARSVLDLLEARAADAADRVGIGSQLGEFTLLRELGRGGMGVVYEALQASVPGRHVALKLLHATTANGMRLARFRREIEVVGRLDHPHIVSILSAELDSQTPWYAMKFVAGATLETAPAGEAPDYGALARTFRDLARALDHAHGLGVVHRDVKASNIMIEPDGSALLVDFGLAHDDLAQSTLTLGEDALGSVDTMAPEQVSPKVGRVSPATDVYGLGATLYQSLTGERAFPGKTLHQVFERILVGHPTPPRRLRADVPVDLEAICLKAMAPAIGERYASAGAMAEDLDAFLDFRPISARTPGNLQRVLRSLRRHRATSLTAALLVAVVAGAWFRAAWWTPSTRLGEARAALAKGDLQAAERAAAVVATEYAGADWAWEALEIQALVTARRIDARLEQLTTPSLKRRACAQRVTETRARLVRAEAIPPIARDGDVRAQLADDLTRLEGELTAAEGHITAELDALLAIDSSHPPLRAVVAVHAARRLRQELMSLGAHFRPNTVATWEARLAAVDDDGAFAPLLDARGEISVTCPQGPAEAWLQPAVERDGMQRFDEDPSHGIALGATPSQSLLVPEGSWLLIVRREGAVDTRLPLLVRRREVQQPRERELVVDVHDRATIGEGWVFVPAGFSVLGDRERNPSSPAPLLTWVDAFFVMRDEVDEARFHDVLSANEGVLREVFGERSAPRPRSVGDLTSNDAEQYVQFLNHREATRGPSARWFHQLPTPQQWERTGRGADGRLYPWGDRADFSFSANYWSCTDADQSHSWRPHPAQDTSPFGVRGLAGGQQEVCVPTDAINTLGRAKVWLRGGSTNSRTAGELTLVAEQVEDAELRRSTIGLRVVRTPLMALADDPVAPFHDDFQRASGESEMDRGWHAWFRAGETFAPDRRAWIADGALQLRGYAGHFSRGVVAWHEVSLPSHGFRVRARTQFECEQPGAYTRRSFTLALQPRPEWHHAALQIWTSVSCDGEALLGTKTSAGLPIPEFKAGALADIELTVNEDTVEMRTWPVGSARPADPLLTMPTPTWTQTLRPRVLVLEAGNLEQVTVRVEQVWAEPID